MENTIAMEAPVMEAPEKKKGLTSFSIKLIAVITMFIDHAAAIILERYLYTLGMGSNDYFAVEHAGIFYTYVFLRAIGRIAFPIYIFLLVQGFGYTKNRLKYAIRLLAFALISEIPFNLAFGKSLWTFAYQNVFWTLFFGFLFMWFSDFVYSRVIKPWLGYIAIILAGAGLGSYFGIGTINILYSYSEIDLTATSEIITVISIWSAVLMLLLILVNRKKTFNELSQAALSVLVLSALMWAGDLFHTDYGAAGVLAIAFAYVFREKNGKSFGMTMVPLIFSSILEAVALVDLIAIKHYNGEKGKSMKYFFYAFYPCHILLLYLIACLLGLGN